MLKKIHHWIMHVESILSSQSLIRSPVFVMSKLSMKFMRKRSSLVERMESIFFNNYPYVVQLQFQVDLKIVSSTQHWVDVKRFLLHEILSNNYTFLWLMRC